MSEREDALAIFVRVERSVTKSALEGLGAVVVRPSHFQWFIGMYGRAIGLYRAMVHLLAKGFPDEAMMLGRSLFEESLRLTRLAELDGQDRVDLVVGWRNASFMRQIGLMTKARDLGVGWGWEEVITRLEGDSKKLLAYGVRKGSGKPKRFDEGTVKRLANKRGRQGGLWMWEAASQVVHGEALAHLYRQETIEDNILAFRLHNPSVVAILEVGSFGAESLLESHRAICEIMEWEWTAAFDQLSSEVDSVDQMAGRLVQKEQ